jgi:Spy/CpxP family protein refolding chaperone
MKNPLIHLLPLLAIVITTPAVAAINYIPHNHHTTAQNQIANYENGKWSSDLNLTAEQKTKMQASRAATNRQIEEVLTSEQRQKLVQIKSQRQTNRQGEVNENRMNLTADQKTKLKAIRADSRTQLKAVLTAEQQAQLSQNSSNWSGNEMSKLNLTTAQTAKMQELRTAASNQINAILTPQQQQQHQVRRERHQTRGNTWKSLNLTPAQQAKIKTIRQAGKEQLNTILTPEQQIKIKSHRHGGWRNHT